MIQITKNNQTIELRNLPEQVLKNKQDIAQHYNMDRTVEHFGIRIKGAVQREEELDNVVEKAYGDGYFVGYEAPFDLYLWLPANEDIHEDSDYWFNMGPLSLRGEQGSQGNPGAAGKTGRTPQVLFGTDPQPSADGDLYINTVNGNLYQTIGGVLNLVSNIMGPMGPQGKQGIQGLRGAQGNQGIQGMKGDPGAFIHIVGLLLEGTPPAPSTLNDLGAAYLVGQDKHLYIQVGETSETAIWNDLGPLNVSTLVQVNGQYVGEWNADTKRDVIDVEELDSIEVYAASPDGQTSIPVSVGVSQNSIVMRNDGGQITAITPVAATDVPNKAYVDGGFAPKLSTDTTDGSVWTATNTGGQWTKVWKGNGNSPSTKIPTYFTSSTSPNTVINSYLVSSYPTKSNHVATKQYVDNAVSNASGGSTVGGSMMATFYNEAADADITVNFYVETLKPLIYYANSYVGQWDDDNEYRMDSVFSNGEIRIYEPASGEFWVTKDYYFQLVELE